MLTSHYRLGEDYLELPYVLWYRSEKLWAQKVISPKAASAPILRIGWL